MNEAAEVKTKSTKECGIGRVSIAPEKKENTWRSYKNFKINADFFEKGIILVQPDMSSNRKWTPSVDATSFQMKERVFSFTEKPKHSKAEKLLVKLTAFNKDKGTDESSCNSQTTQTKAIVNSQRRDEVFLPLIFDDPLEQNGIYIYPWISDST